MSEHGIPMIEFVIERPKLADYYTIYKKAAALIDTGEAGIGSFDIDHAEWSLTSLQIRAVVPRDVTTSEQALRWAKSVRELFEKAIDATAPAGGAP